MTNFPLNYLANFVLKPQTIVDFIGMLCDRVMHSVHCSSSTVEGKCYMNFSNFYILNCLLGYV